MVKPSRVSILASSMRESKHLLQLPNLFGGPPYRGEQIRNEALFFARELMERFKQSGQSETIEGNPRLIGLLLF
jgi:hypothetical protein